MSDLRRFILVSAAALVAATVPGDGGTITHIVKNGESLSLICIDYYGHYSPEMGKSIQEDNPGLSDVNIILTGQKLRLPAPRQSPGGLDAGNGRYGVFVKRAGVRQGVITYVKGPVRLSASAGRSDLTVNAIVNPGDTIETSAQGRVEIIINREGVVRLGGNTRLVLEQFRDTLPTSKTRVGCSAGTVWSKVKKFRDRVRRFDLELPTAVAGVYGTVYEARLAPDSSSEVKVFSGEVAVSGRSGSNGADNTENGQIAGPHEVDGPHEVSMETWTHIVRSMQRIVIAKDGSARAPAPFAHEKSEWETWNRERDRRIARMFEEI